MSTLIERISHFFADNKPLSTLLFVIVFSFGLFAFLVMPKQYNPEILRPAFLVSLHYDGSNPESALNKVGYELIEQLNVIAGVDEVMMQVTDGGSIQATVIFSVGEDAAKAKSDLLTQLEGNIYLATNALGSVNIREINPETIPVLQIAFSSPVLTVDQVRNEIESWRGELLNIDGVSEMTILGGEQKSSIIEVDPALMQEKSVRISEVVAALHDIDKRIVSPGYENALYKTPTALSLLGTTSVAILGYTPINTNIVLHDVASVYEGYLSQRSYTLYTSDTVPPTEVVMLGVSKRDGFSAPTVTNDILEKINTLSKQRESKEISSFVVSDDGLIAKNEINGLAVNLMQSILIVAVVLFLFLSFRAALVVLITVPLTFLVVLGVGYIAGETINRITLFALILSLGLLVDASIVVVDIIYEHLKKAYATGSNIALPVVASLAVKEVGVGLVLSALTSVVVFLPMFYITGMMGPYMGPIAFFVPIALLASLLIAIVLAPFIAIHLLKTTEKTSVISSAFQRGLTKVAICYGRLVRVIVSDKKIRSKLLRSLVFIFVASVSLPLFGVVHFQMLPKADKDQVYVYIDAPQDYSREATKSLTNEVVSVLLKDSAVTAAQSFVAGAPIIDFNGMFKGAQNRTLGSQSTTRLNFIPADNRSESSTEIVDRLRQTLVTDIGDDARFVRLMEDPPGPPVAATFVAKVVGASVGKNELSNTLSEYIKNIAGIVDVYDSLEVPLPQINYVIKNEVLIANGIKRDDVLLWYSLVTNNILLDEITNKDGYERVGLYAVLPAHFKLSPENINSINIHTHNGQAISLGTLLDVTYTDTPDNLYVEDAETLEYVTAEVSGRSIIYVMIDVMFGIARGGLSDYEVIGWNLFGMDLKNSSGEVLKIVWGGEWEMTLENFRDLGIAMAVALFLVYSVLVAQYRSFKVPGLILMTVPLSLIGILWGFLLLDNIFGIYLTATALIGFIALIGIVVNNAIIYLEYVEQALGEGVAYTDALVEAGQARLRPILATSLTTVLGSLTIVSDPVWSGLAWSIVFGLSLSTVLTLIVLPALLANSKDN